MYKTIVAGLVAAVVTAACVFGAVKFNPDLAPDVPVPSVPDDAPAPPADPNAAAVIIKAPTSVPAGTLVVLDVSGSNATNFAWKVVPETPNFMVIDGGKRAVFSGTGGEYLFIVCGGKGDTVDIKTHSIVVDGPIVPPGPPSPADIAAKVAKWCEPVDSPTKRDDALKLAQSFSSVAAVISPVMTPADIVDATRKSNQDALGSNVERWEPFLRSLQAELKSQAEAGLLPDTEAHAVAWRSVADGLKQYADKL
jgi:hypothetical protein